MKNHEDTKFYYVRNAFWPNSNAHITVAFKVLEHDNEQLTYACQAAFSSPNERFSKKTGRLIADGRMAKHPFQYCLKKDANKGCYRQIIEHLQSNAISDLGNSHSPEWWVKMKKQKQVFSKNLEKNKAQYKELLRQLEEGFFEPKPWEV